MKFRQMTFDEWWDEFKPVVNHLVGPDKRSCDNRLFETFGAEDEYVRKVAGLEPQRVWTLLDCDGVQVIGDGWHWVNRVGYFVTEVPASEGTDYEVMYDDGEDFE